MTSRLLFFSSYQLNLIIKLACGSSPVLTIIADSLVEVPVWCPDYEGRVSSGITPKLHIRAESLSLESLGMSRTVGCDSLDIPKFGRESLNLEN